MSFRVGIHRGFRLPRALNLTEAELREQLLVPGRLGRAVSLVERDGKPAGSELRMLEGPELDSARRRAPPVPRGGRPEDPIAVAVQARCRALGFSRRSARP